MTVILSANAVFLCFVALGVAVLYLLWLFSSTKRRIEYLRDDLAVAEEAAAIVAYLNRTSQAKCVGRPITAGHSSLRRGSWYGFVDWTDLRNNGETTTMILRPRPVPGRWNRVVQVSQKGEDIEIVGIPEGDPGYLE